MVISLYGRSSRCLCSTLRIWNGANIHRPVVQVIQRFNQSDASGNDDNKGQKIPKPINLNADNTLIEKNKPLVAFDDILSKANTNQFPISDVHLKKSTDLDSLNVASVDNISNAPIRIEYELPIEMIPSQISNNLSSSNISEDTSNEKITIVLENEVQKAPLSNKEKQPADDNVKYFTFATDVTESYIPSPFHNYNIDVKSDANAKNNTTKAVNETVNAPKLEPNKKDVDGKSNLTVDSSHTAEIFNFFPSTPSTNVSCDKVEATNTVGEVDINKEKINFESRANVASHVMSQISPEVAPWSGTAETLRMSSSSSSSEPPANNEEKINILGGQQSDKNSKASTIFVESVQNTDSQDKSDIDGKNESQSTYAEKPKEPSSAKTPNPPLGELVNAFVLKNAQNNNQATYKTNKVFDLNTIEQYQNSFSNLEVKANKSSSDSIDQVKAETNLTPGDLYDSKSETPIYEERTGRDTPQTSEHEKLMDPTVVKPTKIEHIKPSDGVQAKSPIHKSSSKEGKAEDVQKINEAELKQVLSSEQFDKKVEERPSLAQYLYELIVGKGNSSNNKGGNNNRRGLATYSAVRGFTSSSTSDGDTFISPDLPKRGLGAAAILDSRNTEYYKNKTTEDNQNDKKLGDNLNSEMHPKELTSQLYRVTCLKKHNVSQAPTFKPSSAEPTMCSNNEEITWNPQPHFIMITLRKKIHTTVNNPMSSTEIKGGTPHKCEDKSPRAQLKRKAESSQIKIKGGSKKCWKKLRDLRKPIKDDDC
ncbi:Sodh-2 [Drosophila busckii]|uniref:Sodh-2 n=1 Tax=Drosophila busckii TaxID=30019 RepID=A0A0M4EJZ4_DROBS|nr:Sodh-2 [Drosophila busckii]